MLQLSSLKIKEFKKNALRGYNPEEVDEFIHEVARRWNELVSKYNESLEQSEHLHQSLQYYRNMEQTIQNALVLAEKTAAETKQNAEVAATEKRDAILKDVDTLKHNAKVESKKLIDNAKAESTKCLEDARTDSKKLMEDANKKSVAMLSEAKETAKNIVSEAKIKAQDIFNQTQEEASKVLEQAKNQAAEIEEYINELYKENQNEIHNMLNSYLELKQNTINTFEGYISELQKPNTLDKLSKILSQLELDINENKSNPKKVKSAQKNIKDNKNTKNVQLLKTNHPSVKSVNNDSEYSKFDEQTKGNIHAQPKGDTHAQPKEGDAHTQSKGDTQPKSDFLDPFNKFKAPSTKSGPTKIKITKVHKNKTNDDDEPKDDVDHNDEPKDDAKHILEIDHREHVEMRISQDLPYNPDEVKSTADTIESLLNEAIDEFVTSGKHPSNLRNFKEKGTQ